MSRLRHSFWFRKRVFAANAAQACTQHGNYVGSTGASTSAAWHGARLSVEWLLQQHKRHCAAEWGPALQALSLHTHMKHEHCAWHDLALCSQPSARLPLQRLAIGTTKSACFAPSVEHRNKKGALTGGAQLNVLPILANAPHRVQGPGPTPVGPGFRVRPRAPHLAAAPTLWRVHRRMRSHRWDVQGMPAKGSAATAVIPQAGHWQVRCCSEHGGAAASTAVRQRARRCGSEHGGAAQCTDGHA
jgi:hypothetical protein